MSETTRVDTETQADEDAATTSGIEAGEADSAEHGEPDAPDEARSEVDGEGPDDLGGADEADDESPAENQGSGDAAPAEGAGAGDEAPGGPEGAGDEGAADQARGEAPASARAGADAEGVNDESAAQAPAVTEQPPPAAPRRGGRSRRATRPTSAPEHEAEQPAAPEGQGSAAPEAEQPAAPEGQGSAAPEAEQPAVATTEARSANVSGLDVLAELGSVKARSDSKERKRSTSTDRKPSTVTEAAAAALGSIVFEAPVRGQSESADEAAPSSAARSAAHEEQTGDAGPRLPVTALLFQAPDLTSAASRSRRAQSPAGPPTFGDEAGAPGPTAGGEEAEAPESRSRSRRRRPESADEEAGGPAEEAVDDSDTEEDESSDEGAPGTQAGPRRRRRRGGRGRRNRAATGPGTDAGSDEGEDTSGADLGEEAVEGKGDDQAGGPGEARDAGQGGSQRRRQGQRGGRGSLDQAAEAVPGAEPGETKGDEPAGAAAEGEGVETSGGDESGSSSSRRRRRRRRGNGSSEGGRDAGRPPASRDDEVTALKGSTRLEAKRQRRREGRDAGRRRTVVTEAEFLARRESVERAMVVRERGGRTQIAVLEDNVLVEHFVARRTQTSMVGNVYLGRVQNVLPSMEAAFVDLGKGRNAVLYAGEVNWDAAGMEGQPRRIEQALSSGDSVMVQVTKDPIGHKGARLTSQITLAGRYLVLVPSGGMTGISRKLPDTERARLKKLLREIVPDGAGVIVRTAAEGASEEELRLDVARLQVQWAEIERKAKSAPAPSLLHGEPDLAIRVVRDVFNEDFGSVTISGDEAWDAIAGYIESIAPDLAPRLHRWTSSEDVFHANRIDEQIAKAMDRKVWLPSGGSLVIDRTEAMTVIDVNTGKFVGTGGTLEETVTRNNLEAAEEIVRQLRLRDIGGIIVIDFIDMVLESNRDLVLRRLVECLGRDRTRHQVAEVTSLGLVQMTRKRVGQGLVEAFSEACEACNGRGYIVHTEPVEKAGVRAPEVLQEEPSGRSGSRRRGRRATDAAGGGGVGAGRQGAQAPDEAAREAVKATLATIAAAAAHAHDEGVHGDAAEDRPLADASIGADDDSDESEIVIDFDAIRSPDTVRERAVDTQAARGEAPQEDAPSDGAAAPAEARADEQGVPAEGEASTGATPADAEPGAGNQDAAEQAERADSENATAQGEHAAPEHAASEHTAPEHAASEHTAPEQEEPEHGPHGGSQDEAH